MPLLVLWFGYEQKEATGTSLAAIIVIGVLAAGVQALKGNVDLEKGILIGVPAGPACSPGPRSSSASRRRRWPARSWCPCWLRPRCWCSDGGGRSGLLALGFAAGMAGGLLGVGGGVVFVPALVVFADQSQLGAEANVAGRDARIAGGHLRQRGYGNCACATGC